MGVLRILQHQPQTFGENSYALGTRSSKGRRDLPSHPISSLAVGLQKDYLRPPHSRIFIPLRDLGDCFYIKNSLFDRIPPANESGNSAKMFQS